jgi:hypothetical protein
MTDRSQPFHSRITALNQTPEGEMARLYLRGTDPQYLEAGQRLATAGLLAWALDNLAADPAWAEAVRQAAAQAEVAEPERMQAAIVPKDLLQTRTRTEAGRLMLQLAADLIPPGSSPA